MNTKDIGMKPIDVTPTGPVFSARLHGLTPAGTYVLVVGKTEALARMTAESVQAALMAPRPVGPPAEVRNPKLVPLPGAGSAFTGSICAVCGSAQVIRTGACETCQSCGSTSSCG